MAPPFKRPASRHRDRIGRVPTIPSHEPIVFGGKDVGL